ncbi:Senescence regulator [Melia azedarach]|uniref:Senescence regulator n=1 Tax=Melia azedarach TaxID=155640 RepID=A0ACC1X1X6_MELAZ|nr:Senescence regulator [Melia azedarach]
MASRKFFHAKPNYIYPTPVADGTTADHHNLFEFDEADMYRSNESLPMEIKKPIPTSRSSRKLAKKIDAGDRRMPVASASLPVNIPDWSKILKEEYREHGKRESDEDIGDDNDDDDGDGYYGLVPPHEYLAMKRGASLSVHEGIGRTLKGRDLRRVRNAIWKQVGFED